MVGSLRRSRDIRKFGNVLWYYRPRSVDGGFLWGGSTVKHLSLAPIQERLRHVTLFRLAMTVCFILIQLLSLSMACTEHAFSVLNLIRRGKREDHHRVLWRPVLLGPSPFRPRKKQDSN